MFVMTLQFMCYPVNLRWKGHSNSSPSAGSQWRWLESSVTRVLISSLKQESSWSRLEGHSNWILMEFGGWEMNDELVCTAKVVG